MLLLHKRQHLDYVHGHFEVLQALQKLTLQEVTADETVWVRSSLSKVTLYHTLWLVGLPYSYSLLGKTRQHHQYCSPKAYSHAVLSQPQATRWSRR